METTVATPMTMPRRVSALLSRWPQKVLSASRRLSTITWRPFGRDTRPPLGREGTTTETGGDCSPSRNSQLGPCERRALVRAHGFDRVEIRSPGGRVDAKLQPPPGRHEQRHHHRPGGNGRRKAERPAGKKGD